MAKGKNSKLIEYYHAQWCVLHSLSFTCKDSKDLQGLNDMLQALTLCLPCDTCKEHLQAYLQTNSLNSCEKAPAYVLDLHNQVNLQNGKPAWVIDKLEEKYQHLNPTCNSDATADVDGSNSPSTKKMPKFLHILIVSLFVIAVMALCINACSFSDNCSV